MNAKLPFCLFVTAMFVITASVQKLLETVSHSWWMPVLAGVIEGVILSSAIWGLVDDDDLR